MSEILIFSDLHIHPHRRSIERLHDCLNALEWVFQTVKERNIKDVVFAGDLFHDRQKIDVMTYQLTFEVLEKHCKGNFKLWLLLGNHDLWYHDKWDISSVKPLAALPGVTVVDKPCSLEVAGHIVDFIPYTHHPIDHLENLKKSKNKTLFGHLAVNGAQLNTMYNVRADVVIEHDGEMTYIEPSLFDSWEKVWLGHYHGQQKLGHVEYVGSPLQLSFGEAFQHKHIIIYDLSDGSTEYIRNNFSPQHLIIPESDLDKYDVSKNFIKLMVEDIAATNIIDIKNNLKQLKPASLEILPIEKSQEEQTLVITEAKALVNNAEMLEKYVDQVEKNGLDRDRLLKLGRLICQK